MAQDKTFDDGKQEQFQEMMARFTEIASKYGGVRGELLAKVKDELTKLKPGKVAVSPPAAAPARAPVAKVATSAPAEVPAVAPAKAPVAKVVTANFLPSCRACGRTMKEGPQGSLVCQNGHTRLLAG